MTSYKTHANEVQLIMLKNACSLNTQTHRASYPNFGSLISNSLNGYSQPWISSSQLIIPKVRTNAVICKQTNPKVSSSNKSATAATAETEIVSLFLEGQIFLLTKSNVWFGCLQLFGTKSDCEWCFPLRGKQIYCVGGTLNIKRKSHRRETGLECWSRAKCQFYWITGMKILVNGK